MTRVELAVVCCICLVLVGILASSVSSNYRIVRLGSRTYGDIRSVATAVELYCVDQKACPRMRPLREFGNCDERLKKAGGWDLMSVDPGNPARPGLTTPLAYINPMPMDPYSPRESYPFVYFTHGKGWILISAGPDGDYDIHPAGDSASSVTQSSAYLLTHGTYDATNGAMSSGDIWRVGELGRQGL